jgi:hypothetical protein
LSLWDSGHVSAAVLWDVFARYLYLPRLRNLDVLLATVEAGPASLSWQQTAVVQVVRASDEDRPCMIAAAWLHGVAFRPSRWDSYLLQTADAVKADIMRATSRYSCHPEVHRAARQPCGATDQLAGSPSYDAPEWRLTRALLRLARSTLPVGCR